MRRLCETYAEADFEALPDAPNNKLVRKMLVSIVFCSILGFWGNDKLLALHEGPM